MSAYNVSRSTIERALATLKAEGVIESVQGAGWFVAGTGDRRPLVERVTDLLRGEGMKVPLDARARARAAAGRDARTPLV
jgi:DNA-binding GntR family transcriptional regulator